MEKYPSPYDPYQESQPFASRSYFISYQSTGSNGSPGVTRGLPGPCSRLKRLAAFTCIKSSDITRKVLKWCLVFTSVLQIYAGLYLMVDQLPDLAGSFAGFFIFVTAVLLLIAILTDSLALVALIQVFTVSFELILFLLILISLLFGLKDDLLIGLYAASLFCFILKSILIREYLVICASLHPQELAESGFV